jgi:PAS domain S-box-containing protein
MTAIDVLVIAVGIYVLFRIGRDRKQMPFSRNFISHYSIAAGLLILVLFFAADIFIMWVLPILSDSEVAMATMTTLHLDISWLVFPLAIFVVAFGLIQANETLANSLRRTLDSEKRFKDFTESSSDWLWEMDENLRFSRFSKEFSGISGVAAEDLLGKTRQDSRLDLSEEQVRQNIRDLEARVSFRNFEHSRVRQDGSVVYMSTSGRPVYDENGRFKGYRGTGTDITQRKIAEEELKESEQRFRNLMDGSIQGVLITTEDRKPLFANDECAAIFGYDSAQEIMALDSTLPLIAPRELERLNKIRQPYLNGKIEENTVYEFEGVRKDGASIWLELRGGAVEWRGSLAAHLTLVDVTERKRSETARREAREEAEHANRVKSEFLTNMSHELRTPLNAVIGFSQLLEKEYSGPVNEKQKEMLGDIRGAGEHLHDLISDILDFSKIEAGKYKLSFTNIDVAAQINKSIRFVAGRAQEADVAVSVETPENLSALYADERIFRQMLINLLSNSIKFTPARGKIVVAVSQQDGAGTRIDVQDTGIGIKDSDIPTALETFGQVDNTLNRKHDGTGLGIPLVISFMDMHHGKFEIESEVGVGTTARLIFPENF